nr:hypothetical protein [Rhizobium rhizogenes]
MAKSAVKEQVLKRIDRLGKIHQRLRKGGDWYAVGFQVLHQLASQSDVKNDFLNVETLTKIADVVLNNEPIDDVAGAGRKPTLLFPQRIGRGAVVGSSAQLRFRRKRTSVDIRWNLRRCLRRQLWPSQLP